MINSSRPSASVFPPPHLIITRNAHGAEEGEGLGTRLRTYVSVTLRNVEMTSRWNVAVSRLRPGLGIRNVMCAYAHTYSAALAGHRSEIEKPRGFS